MTGPATPLVWLHCGDAASAGATVSLARRLQGRDDDMRALLTCAAVVPNKPAADTPGITIADPPGDTPASTRAFLEQHQPAMLIWIGGSLRPGVLASVQKQGLPAMAVNLDSTHLTGRSMTWRTRPLRTTLNVFGRMLVTNGATSVRLQRIGIEADRVQVTGPILEDVVAPTFDPNELTVMAEAIGSRPSWFAVAVVPGELAQLVQAHRAASRRGHRLLLLVAPRDPADGPEFDRRLRQMGLHAGLRSRGDDPQEDLQVYVTDRPDEHGLWYRLAPLTFMGGTLSGPEGVQPFAPASVGSAVLHGPFVRPWVDQYDRLARAGASRKTRSGAELGVALGELIGPERAAAMAHAGWEEVTRSADTMNALLDRIERVALDGEAI